MLFRSQLFGVGIYWGSIGPALNNVFVTEKRWGVIAIHPPCRAGSDVPVLTLDEDQSNRRLLRMMEATLDTRTEIEKELGIEVVKREKIVSYRETIALRNKARVPEAIAYIQAQIHRGKVTGKVNVNVNQGGVANVLTEQNGKVKLGSELDDLTDEVFCLQKPLDMEPDTA